MSSVEPGQMLQKTMSALRDRDGAGADNADAKARESAYSSIGVVVVTYNSADVIESCLASLLASRDVDIRIAICDNGSTDGTQEIVRDVTAAAKLKLAEMNVADLDKAQRPPRVSLVHSDANRGYAGGVNLGLRLFLNAPRVGLFWVLNPDSEVQPDTAKEYWNRAQEVGDFGLMAGRTLYHDQPGVVQSDGGKVNWWTGACRNVNQGAVAASVEMPAAAGLDFASGANLVASRNFVESVGLMQEDYFLYYEEVDWAVRGLKDHSLEMAPKAIVTHHGGTAIGSGANNRAPSAFSNYFNFRNRMWFVRRFAPLSLPVAWGWGMAKSAKYLLQGHYASAWGALCGLNGFPPPKAIRARISDDAQTLAFGKRPRG